MLLERASSDESSSTGAGRNRPLDAATRRFSALNVVIGLLGLVGPAVWENDDDGLVNVEPGMFLGKVAVNGPHALVHVAYGALGLAYARDDDSARRFVTLSALFWAAMSAMGWRAFGFERGVHMVMGLAVDGWANVAHGLFSALCAAYALRPRAEG